MILKIKHFVVFITIVQMISCKTENHSITRIKAEKISIDSTLTAIDSIENYISPYRNRINEVLDSTLAYAPKMLTKVDGIFNTSAGNLMADIVLSEANAIFKARTGNEIDFVLLNHGGIRAIISAGNVSARTAYEVMPFENSIVVVELKGETVLKLVNFLINSKRAHPIAGMKITIDRKNQLKSLKILNEPFNKKRNYFVATSDYLLTGGDDMVFFQDTLNSTNTDYLIRNAMIDYFKKVDTLKSVVDDRFLKIL